MASRLPSAPSARPTRLDRLRRHLRRGCDEGAASMISYVVAASVFIVASAFMMSFVADSPGGATNSLEHLDLKTTAATALEVLVGTPGHPANWGDDATSVDALSRLGLIEPGTSVIVNTSKFDALSRGKYLTSSNANGYVDYAEAKAALGLSGYDFHLRAVPVFDPGEHEYGTTGMSAFRVAYVGDYDGATPSAAATAETEALDDLNITFDPTLREDVGTGDVYRDDKTFLKEHLVPLIGTSTSQTVINGGSGAAHDFHRVEAGVYSAHLTSVAGRTKALALSDADADTLGYTKGREIRAVLGSIDMTGLTASTLTWSEWVDTDRGTLSYDAGDYGYPEISADGGVTWCSLVDGVSVTRSEDTLASPHPAAMTARTATIADTGCATVANVASVLVAFHWVGDNDNNIGHGWVLDDVEVTAVSGLSTLVLMRKTFESPEYDMVVFGSNLDQNQLTANEVKEAIRDYVDVYDGRILVLGGEPNTNWLQPLFHVGIRGGSSGLATPDSSHPLLTVPNALDWESFDHGDVSWDFGGSADKDLFSSVVTGENADEHLLSVSLPGAFGSGESDGSITLTTYLPHTMEDDEARRFFANSVTYGRFHHLYLDVGPPLPTSEIVGAATRTAIMDMSRANTGEYIEIAFTLFLWRGSTASETLAAATLTPTAPRDVTATAGDGTVTLTWSVPDSEGTDPIWKYELRRGTAPGDLVLVHETDNLTFSWTDTGLANGVTYYYNVTAVSDAGRGLASNAASATPSGAASAPTWASPSHVATDSEIQIMWVAPTSSGGSAVVGYKVEGREPLGAWTTLAEMGNSTTYTHTGLPAEATREYRVSALNAYGYGDVSSTLTATTLPLTISAPESVSAVNGTNAGEITLAWAPPAELSGTSVTGYRVWRSDDGGSVYAALATTGPAVLTYTDTGLGANTTRHYKLQAITDGGDGELSSAVNARTYGVPYPVQALDAGPVLSGAVAVTWLAPAYSDLPVLHYEVYRALAGGVGEPADSEYALVAGEVLTTSYADSGLTGSSYYYRVVAVSSAGSSHPAQDSTG